MASRSEERKSPTEKPASGSNPEAGTGGGEYARAIAGNIIESRRLVAGPVEAHDRNAMIAEAACYRAERRGVEPGGELEDWLAAEREIDESTGTGVIG